MESSSSIPCLKESLQASLLIILCHHSRWFSVTFWGFFPTGLLLGRYTKGSKGVGGGQASPQCKVLLKLQVLKRIKKDIMRGEDFPKKGHHNLEWSLCLLLKGKLLARGVAKYFKRMTILGSGQYTAMWQDRKWSSQARRLQEEPGACGKGRECYRACYLQGVIHC